MKSILVRGRSLALLLALMGALAGCQESPVSSSTEVRGRVGEEGGAVRFLAVVSIDRVMRESKAGRAGTAHLEAAKANLQKGWEALKAAAENEPAEQRRQTLARGLATLQRQVRAEEASMREAIRDVLAAEIRLYRREHPGIVAVVPRESLLDAAPELDITRVVIGSMDRREVTFPPLPEVTIHPADAPEEPGAAETGGRPASRVGGKGAVGEQDPAAVGTGSRQRPRRPAGAPDSAPQAEERRASRPRP